MSDLVARLTAALKEPLNRPEDAERAARIASALAELLRASQDAESLLATAPSVTPKAAESLAGKSLHRAAKEVLEESGRPLHATELGQHIKARGWKHPRGEPSRPDQIVHQLAARLPKFKKIFRRVGPNTFALAKWGDTATRRADSKPGLATFSGPGGETGREIGATPDLPAANSWRSS